MDSELDSISKLRTFATKPEFCSAKACFGARCPEPDVVLNNLTLGWSAGFFIAGLLNLIVAYNFSLDAWVSYKLFGGIIITLVYFIIMMIYLWKEINPML